MRLGDEVFDHLDWCISYKKPCIFVTDLRRIPFQTYITLSKFYKSKKCDPKIVIVGQNLFIADYGNNINFFLKIYRIIYLIVIHEASINFKLNSRNYESLEVGIRSSAVSLTRNENINKNQNQQLFEGLEKLALNANFCSIWALHNLKYDVAFVFNGRLASSLPIRLNSEIQGIPIGYIEYGFEGLARVYPFSPHFNKSYPALIDKYWETCKIDHSKKIAISLHYMKLKMTNRFTRFYIHEDDSERFEFTFFVNSNDEYVSILQGGGDEKLKLVDQIKILDELYNAFPKSSLCVRCHPNMRFADRSFEKELKLKCDALGISFISSDDNTNSYSLIARSKYVVVGTSSIALDATLLGAKVIVAGDAKYKTMLGIQWNDFLENKNFDFDIVRLHKFCFFSANYGMNVK